MKVNFFQIRNIVIKDQVYLEVNQLLNQTTKVLLQDLIK